MSSLGKLVIQRSNGLQGLKETGYEYGYQDQKIVSDNQNRVIEIAFRKGMKQIPDTKKQYLLQKKPESAKWPNNPDKRIKFNLIE